MLTMICESLNSLARETWRQIELGHNSGYGTPDERAFTDHHLLELMGSHPLEVSAVKFDQGREAETAADFEWWLGDGSEYLPMRVQAKKLDPESGTYLEVGHEIGDTIEKQLDRLATSARDEGFLPVYVFFNGPIRHMSWPEDRCEDEALPEDYRGCTVATAADVGRVISESRGDDRFRFAQVSRPWQCLLCCPLPQAPTAAGRALELLGARDAATTSDLPDYVQAMIEADPSPGLKSSQTAPGASRVMTMTLR